MSEANRNALVAIAIFFVGFIVGLFSSVCRPVNQQARGHRCGECVEKLERVREAVRP